MGRRLGMVMLVCMLMAAGCRAATPAPRPPTVAFPTFPQPTFTPAPPAPPAWLTRTLQPTTPPTWTPPPTRLPPTPTPSPQPVAPSPTPVHSAAYLGVVREGGVLGELWNLADVRYGAHADRFRVVWEMAEPRDHVPRYRVVEVDNAASPLPTGHDPAWGAARIDVVISDLYAYGFPLGERLPIVPPKNPVVTRIGLYPTFDDALLGFSIGLKLPAAYEVYELTNPVRIVIDVLY